MKEGSESTLGCEGSAQSRSEQIWGRGRCSGRPGEAAPHRGRGECRGHGGDAQGVQNKEAREGSKNERDVGQDRAGVACVTPVRGGRGRLMWSEVFKESLLCFAENKQ